MEQEKELLTVAQVAEKLQISRYTLIRWEKKGLISAVVLPSGRKRYRAHDVDEMLKGDRRNAGKESSGKETDCQTK